MSSWYVLVQGPSGPAPNGPFSVEQMRAKAASGSLTATSQVAQVGASGWTEANRDPLLASLFPAAVPAPVARPADPHPVGGQGVDPGRLAGACAAGVFTAAVGAAIWAAISYATGYQIGYMAVGVGFLVGMSVRVAGQSRSPVFGVAGAILALGGCVLGNIWSACVFGAAEEHVPMVDVCLYVLGQPALWAEILAETTTPIDFVFYAIAIYEGFRFAKAPPAPATAA